MKLYGFDDTGQSLERLPLAARRALDEAGVRITQRHWSSLPAANRQWLIELGGNEEIIRNAVIEALGSVPFRSIFPRAILSRTSPPEALITSYSQCGPLGVAIWTSLSDLDRYALDKTAERTAARLQSDDVSENQVQERLNAAYREIVGYSQVSTHVQAAGGVQMVNVGVKAVTKRRAEAQTRVVMSAEAFGLLAAHQVPKGDVLGTARIAGIMAAKRTSDLIPLCHVLALTHVSVDLQLVKERSEVSIAAVVETVGKTGVEMEALVAASAAALTIYDMLKGVDRAMQIGPTRLASKSGGASGEYRL